MLLSEAGWLQERVGARSYRSYCRGLTDFPWKVVAKLTIMVIISVTLASHLPTS